MALRAVPEHPKFASLKAQLGLTKFQTLGLLETLWHFTGKFAPRGNVGKFTDLQIEAWLEWAGEQGAVIRALCAAGWLDEHHEHRLIVHDWHMHADATTKKQLGRMKEAFVSDMSGQKANLSGHVLDMSGQNGKVSGPPEPVPVPEPEPGTGPVRNAALSFDHDMVATSVMAETGTGGMKLRILLADIAMNAIAAGESGEYVRDLIIGQWRAYCDAMPRLEWTYGSLEKFLVGGHWRDPKRWPWKSGHSPPKERATRVDALAEVKAQREQAERERGTQQFA